MCPVIAGLEPNWRPLTIDDQQWLNADFLRTICGLTKIICGQVPSKCSREREKTLMFPRGPMAGEDLSVA